MQRTIARTIHFIGQGFLEGAAADMAGH